MNIITIKTRRNGYAPEQCNKTVTVGDLIKILSEYEPDDIIYTEHDNGYTFGNIQHTDVAYYEADE